MSPRFTLQIKLVLSTALVVILSFLVLAHLTINSQKEFFQSTFQDLAINIAQTLEANIASRKDLEDSVKIQSNILKMIWLNPRVVSISVNLLMGEKLETIASSDSELIGKEPSPENFYSYRDGRIRATKIRALDKTELLRVITPIHIGGQRVGTYEIKLSLQELIETVSKTQRQFLIMILISVVFIIFSLSFLMQLTVVNPVKELREGMKEVGEGKLNFRIKTKRKDEFGDLISGFNQMASELQTSYQQLKEIQKGLEEKIRARTQELEEAKLALEIKVRARTQELRNLAATLEERVKERTKALQESQEELQKKVEELEKFHQLAVGRELKMLEMKREIEKLEKELKAKTQSNSKK